MLALKNSIELFLKEIILNLNKLFFEHLLRFSLNLFRKTKTKVRRTLSLNEL